MPYCTILHRNVGHQFLRGSRHHSLSAYLEVAVGQIIYPHRSSIPAITAILVDCFLKRSKVGFKKQTKKALLFGAED